MIMSHGWSMLKLNRYLHNIIHKCIIVHTESLIGYIIVA